MTTTALAPARAFYCYDPADRAFCGSLDRHLAPLKHAGRLQTWDEQHILAGQEREGERARYFSTAQLLLLLISPEFLASESGQSYIQLALERQQTGEAIVIPVLIRPCLWEETALQSLQMLPRGHTALSLQMNQDQAWQEVVSEVRRVLDTLRRHVYVIAAPEDQVIVEDLAQSMTRAGVALWRVRGTHLSPDLAEEREAMRLASSVILIVSPAAFSSRMVRTQKELAEVYKRPMQVVWVNGEDGVESGMDGWHEDALLDARAEQYDRAKETLVTRIAQAHEVASPLEKLSPPDTEPRNPYKGLHSFTMEDQRDFFGREALLEELFKTLEQLLVQERERKVAARVLTLLGASGSGKSSVVLAGLLPHLQQGGVCKSEEWLYLDPIVPGTHPLEALALCLAQHPALGNGAALHRELTSDSLRALHLLTRQLAGSSSRKIVLFIDQFEEVFTLTASQEERQHFFDLLVTAVTEPGGALLVLVTLRADFFAQAMQYPALYRLLKTHAVSVLPMEREELRQMIEQPARLPDVQLAFEGDLVGELLFDAREQAGSLPLLEFALDQLFTHRQGHLLTQAAYREMGGLKGALARHAEAVYNNLPTTDHQALARLLFLRLIEPGQSAQDATRRRAAFTELDLPDPHQTTILRATMDLFLRARLLTASEYLGTATVEVSHEALLREWKRLATWLNEAREDLPLQHKITEDATNWQQHRQGRDRLYRGSQLKEAQAWARRNVPSQAEAAFLQAGARQRTRSRMSILVLVLLFLSSIGAGTLLSNHFLQPDPTLVTTWQDTGSVGSLRWALNNAPSGSTITFASSLERKTIVLTSDLVIPNAKRLTLQYSGPAKQAISQAKNTVLVDAGGSLTLINLSLLGGSTNPSWLLTNHGKLTLMSSTISGNTAHGSGGGGISNNGGTVTLTNSIVSGNTTDNGVEGGGGISNNGGTMTLTDSIVSGNTTDGSGGGISNNGGTMTLTNSTVSGNTADNGFGGGISNDGPSTMTLTNSIVSGNSTDNGFGGGISNDGISTITLTNSTVSGNTAHDGGGGIYGGGTMTLTNSTVSGNTAHDGGGIYSDGTTTLTNSTISQNATDDDSGGVFNRGGTMSFTFCTVFGNQAASGDNLVTQDSVTGSGGTSVGHTIIQNTLIAESTASTDPDVTGNLTSRGYNLIQDASGIHLQSTDLTGLSSEVLKIDPTLNLNGSKTTETNALLPGSPAIDMIPLTFCHIRVDGVLITTDQRGVKRPQGKACDIGAYEYVP